MGQIQNAFNAGVGSIIASKGIAEHLQSQAFDKIERQMAEGMKLADDAKSITDQMNENNKKSVDIEKSFNEIEKKSNIEHPRDEKSGRFVNKKEYQRKLERDADEAYQALADLQIQQEATAAQAQAFNDRMEMYHKRSNLVQNAINRLPAKKRPELPNLDKIIPQEQLRNIQALKETEKENK